MARGEKGSTVFLTKTCPTCNSEFKVPDVESRRNKRWCSKSCCESHPDKKRASSSGVKRKVKDLNSFLDIKCGQTAKRILKKLNVGCSRCGWKEGRPDLHHINGKKVPNANHHWNLTLLCPNCHRLFHEGKISVKDVIPLEQHIGDSWKVLYYG